MNNTHFSAIQADTLKSLGCKDANITLLGECSALWGEPERVAWCIGVS